MLDNFYPDRGENYDLELTLQGMDLTDLADLGDFGFLTNLAEHECDCEHCTRPHCIYDTIFAEVTTMPTFEAPDGFELEVMARLRSMGNGKYALEVRVWDKARNASVGTILLFLGAGSVYAFFRDAIWRVLPTPQQALKLAAAAGTIPKVVKGTKAVKATRLSRVAQMTKSTALTTTSNLSRMSKLVLGTMAMLSVFKNYFGNRQGGKQA